MAALPGAFLDSLVTRVDGPNVVGITCSGSHARGEAGPYSDIDLQIYRRTLPADQHEPHTMRYWDGHLISLKSMTIESQRRQLQRPEEAIWAVPALKQALILLDKDGSVAALKNAAEAVDWAALQTLADEYAANELMACAEEAHKILNGMVRAHESTVLYGIWGMIKGLAAALAAQRRIMIDTENRYFDLLQDSVGEASEWTHSFRLALGADVGPGNVRPFHTRGAAALQLYKETAQLLSAIIPERHRDVIVQTIRRITSAGF